LKTSAKLQKEYYENVIYKKKIQIAAVSFCFRV